MSTKTERKTVASHNCPHCRKAADHLNRHAQHLVILDRELFDEIIKMIDGTHSDYIVVSKQARDRAVAKLRELSELAQTMNYGWPHPNH